MIAALAGLPLFGLSLAHRVASRTAEPAQAAPALAPKPKPNPDFRLFTDLEPSPEYPYPYPGNLVRGGDPGPQYKQFSYGGCFYRTDSIWVYPKNGFTGTVSLEVLNLPVGIISLTAPSITVSSPTRPAGTSFLLQAASDAATGNATVAVRATSGAIVHTLDREFSLVDVLPPCE